MTSDLIPDSLAPNIGSDHFLYFYLVNFDKYEIWYDCWADFYSSNRLCELLYIVRFNNSPQIPVSKRISKLVNITHWEMLWKSCFYICLNMRLEHIFQSKMQLRVAYFTLKKTEVWASGVSHELYICLNLCAHLILRNTMFSRCLKV